MRNNSSLNCSVSLIEESEEGVISRIPGLGSSKVLQIAAGAEHSALVTGKFPCKCYFKSFLAHPNLLLICFFFGFPLVYADDGSILTWGWGEHGQLGLGDTVDQSIPQIISFGEEVAAPRFLCEVYCGSGFTYAIRTPVVVDSEIS